VQIVYLFCIDTLEFIFGMIICRVFMSFSVLEISDSLVEYFPLVNTMKMPIRFLAVLAALSSLGAFWLFCSTVTSFSSGGIRMQGPGGVKFEAELGSKSSRPSPSKKPSLSP
jgi:hypothetical protein